MRLAALDVPANADQLLYTAPAGKRSIASLNLTNRTAGSVLVRVALTKGAAPADADWIEYETTVPGRTPLVRTGLALAAGDRLYVRASAAGCNAVLYGIEEIV